MSHLLEVANLCVSIPGLDRVATPVRSVDLAVDRGETLCIVGESGSGKSLTSLALLGLLPRNARVSADKLTFAGVDLLNLSAKALNRIRGNRISMIFQDAMSSLNPLITIGHQLEEQYLCHNPGRREKARERAVELLERVGIVPAISHLCLYPHQLSGGMQQRVMIAMALMCNPDLVIADEPTTALDVSIQSQVIRLLGELQRDFGVAMIFVTHDLGVVSRVADRVAVMYGGEVVETGPVRETFRYPEHPYTEGLLRSTPMRNLAPGSRLGAIPGIVPILAEGMTGCAFANRCSYALPACGFGNMPIRPRQTEGYHRCTVAPILTGQGHGRSV